MPVHFVAGCILAALTFCKQGCMQCTTAMPCRCRDLILVMEPATILGALLGSYVNKVRNR